MGQDELQGPFPTQTIPWWPLEWPKGTGVTKVGWLCRELWNQPGGLGLGMGWAGKGREALFLLSVSSHGPWRHRGTSKTLAHSPEVSWFCSRKDLTQNRPNLAPSGAGAVPSRAFEGAQVISHLGVRTGPKKGNYPRFPPKSRQELISWTVLGLSH